jgi:hypothetical protein
MRGDLLPNQFSNLIQNMHRVFGQKTAVIIDKYDKPLLATIDRPDVHREIREELKAFYGVFKSSDAYLQLVLNRNHQVFPSKRVFRLE